MSILSFIGGLFKPAADLVDNLHTSTEEKMKLQNQLAEIQAKTQDKLMQLELARLEAVSKVEVAESASTHWLRANWRPLASIALVGAVFMDGNFGYKMSPSLMELANMFLGVYAGGRSLEKIAGVFKK